MRPVADALSPRRHQYALMTDEQMTEQTNRRTSSPHIIPTLWQWTPQELPEIPEYIGQLDKWHRRLHPETGTRKPVPVSSRSVMQFDTNFSQYQNLVRVRVLLYSVKETGTGFLMPVFGTGFWIACHGPYSPHLLIFSQSRRTSRPLQQEV